MWFTTGSGRIELNLTKAQALRGSHAGMCDADIRELRRIPAICRQLAKIKPALLAAELREYADWDTFDHEDNLDRLLWIACGDIADNIKCKGGA